MESVDRRAMAEAIYPTLRSRVAGDMSRRALDNVIAATAEGYPFPTNLDRDQPLDGLTPLSQADIVRRALAESWSIARLSAELDDLGRRRAT
jgi:hypothetical protein